MDKKIINITVKQMEDVKLNCTLQGGGVTWKQGDGSEIILSNRIKIVNNLLIISNASLQDAGEYVCSKMTPQGIVSYQVNVGVNVTINVYMALRILNWNFIKAYENESSPEYKNFTNHFKHQMDIVYKDLGGYIGVEIFKIFNGSLRMRFRVIVVVTVKNKVDSVTGMKVRVTQKVVIRARNGWVESLQVDKDPKYMELYQSPPPPPENVTVVETLKDGAEVAWDLPLFHEYYFIKGYFIEYWKFSSETKERTRTLRGKRTKLTDLESDTAYAARVVAENINGIQGEKSQQIDIKTKSGMPNWLLAVVIICVIFLIVVLTGIIVYCRRKNFVTSFLPGVLIAAGKELGIRGNVIPDGSFYASSVSDSSHGPERGRLDQRASGGQASSWCAKFVNSDQWLAVDLLYAAEVSAIATQGQYDPTSLGSAPNYTQSWVTKYTLEYSNDNKTYYAIGYKTENPLIFKGNEDGNNITCHELPYTVTTRFLRFRPKEWNDNRICLRIGVFGRSLAPNGTTFDEAFSRATGDPGHDGMWWWTLFWVLMTVILVVFVLGLLFYYCIVRNRTYSQEKYIKIKPPKDSVKRRPENSYVNEAYDMTVITNKSGATTPETVEELEGDEIQEVTAEFTADEEENKKGIIGFSVTDEDKPDGEDVANGDVNWEKYRKKALQRPEHTYVNVKDVTKET